ncbi:hypothetical protein [Parasphingorhabdus sp.]|uniref:hypothetical protein n=1 Tax=Parasphingorhabdus sp. TaxID=2709688 RepID=UPI003592FD79
MAYNLFIAYDLNEPGQKYEAVRDAIKKLGQWHQFQYSLFYVNTIYSPNEAYAAIQRLIDANDSLVVIDAKGGIVSTGDKPLIAAINQIWFAP